MRDGWFGGESEQEAGEMTLTRLQESKGDWGGGWPGSKDEAEMVPGCALGMVTNELGI